MLICCISVLGSKIVQLKLFTAEDWLKPSVVIEAFEARAARMSVACAKNISKMPSPEAGMF